MNRKNILLYCCIFFSILLFSGCGIVHLSEKDIGEKTEKTEKIEEKTLDIEKLKSEIKLDFTQKFSEEIQQYRKKYPEISLFQDIKYIETQKKKSFFQKFLEKNNKTKIDCGLEREEFCKEQQYLKENSGRVTALFFGDMMFDRYIRQTLDAKGWEYILDDEMKWFMQGADLTFVNFESAITADTPYKAHDLMMSFTSDPKWLPKMKEYGVDAVSLANNHSMNRGEEGFKKTLYSLNTVEISGFGNPKNNLKINTLSIIKNIRGIKIGFVAYHELFRPNPKPILDEIKKLKNEEQVDFIVIYAHWGEEYKPYIQRRLQIKAHQFINAGADIIIGHHPHVVAAHEEYKGKHIYYSLGNFVFDQVRSKSVNRRLGVGITFECIPQNRVRCSQKKITPHLFPLISNTDFQVRLMNREEQEDFLKYFEKISP